MIWGFPGYPSDHCKIWSTLLTSFLKTITFPRISDPPCCTIFEISAPRRLSVSPPSQELVSSLPPHRIYSHWLLPNETKSFNEVAYGNRSSRTTALTCHCKTTKKYNSRFYIKRPPSIKGLLKLFHVTSVFVIRSWKRCTSHQSSRKLGNIGVSRLTTLLERANNSKWRHYCLPCVRAHVQAWSSRPPYLTPFCRLKRAWWTSPWWKKLRSETVGACDHLATAPSVIIHCPIDWQIDRWISWWIVQYVWLIAWLTGLTDWLRKFNIGSPWSGTKTDDGGQAKDNSNKTINQTNKPRLNKKVRELHILTSRLKLSTKQLSIKQPATQQQRRQRTSVICRRESQSPSNPVSPGPSSSFADVLNAVRTLSSNSRSMWSLERQPRMLHFNVTQVIARTKNADDRGGM